MRFFGSCLGRASTRGVALIPLFLMGPWTDIVSASPFAGIANVNDSSVSAIDRATNTVAATVPSCVAPPSGMVAWWPMDDVSGATSLQDIIGDGSNINNVSNNLSVIGNDARFFASPLGAAQAPQPVSGMVNGAIHFPKFGNALSQASVSPQGALVGIGSVDFTIEAWVAFQSAPANRLHYIVNRFDTTRNKGYALYVISSDLDNGRLEFKWGDGTTVSTVQTISTFAHGQFRHVAVTFARNVGPNALDIRLYVDGTQRGQQVGNPPGVGSLANFLVLQIGSQPGSIDEPITIDELGIFNVALSQSDIQSIYNAGSAGKCRCVTGGQSVDLTVASAGAVFGVGSGVAATVSSSSPLTVNYSIQSLRCSGHEMFLLAAVNGGPFFYLDNSSPPGWIPVALPLSTIAPGPFGSPSPPLFSTSIGAHTLFSGTLPTGAYDLILLCDLFNNGHLDVTNPPLCLSGAGDYLPLTVQ